MASASSCGIRAKIVLAFIAAGIAVAAFTLGVVALQFKAVEQASQLEAGNLARLVAYDIGNGVRDPQKLVEGLDDLYRRDIVIVDADQKGVADAHRVDLGRVYSRDEGDEIGQTIVDGRTRAFFERSPRHPDGAREIAVAIRRAGRADAAISGAVVLEYTAIHDELLHSAMSEIWAVGAAGLLCVMLVALTGVRLADSITQRLARVQRAVERVAEGGTQLPIPAMGDDEIGALAVSFNRMSRDLAQGRSRLVDEMEKTRESARQIEYLAHHDRLTGLPNRSRFSNLLGQAMRSARAEGRTLALMFIDLDRFRNINDGLGRAAGDRLLGEVARRLLACLQDGELVAHLGGDEFVVALPQCRDAHAAQAAERILAAISRPMDLQGTHVGLTASIGVGVFPADGEDERTLMQHAEIALYRAKDDGRNCCVVFAPHLDKQSVERLAFESSLQRALAREQFRVVYQPKVDCRSGRTHGVEALLRWNHPDLGTVPPSKFIPIAEESGLIVALGRWVLRRTCEQQVRWRAQGLPALRVAVNLSARQLADPQLVGDIRAILAETGIEPACLELEITESMLMHDVERAIETLAQIKRLGVALSVDDFGTGYSSLSHLKRFPVDTLKIDRSFVRDLAVDEGDRAIVVAIIAMAKTLRLSVVAEGAETLEQVEFLRAQGCDEIQGFFFSRPVPPEAIPALLEPRPGFVEDRCEERIAA